MKSLACTYLTLLCISVLTFAITSQCVYAQQEVDVYIVTGQSNAANFAQRAGTGNTSVGYNLTFARDRTIFTDPSHVDQEFSSGSLDSSQAVTLLSQGLFQSNDQAIFGFARSGTTIADQEAVSWFPGDDPANGQVDDSNYYSDFANWTNARLAELTAAGKVPVVKGVFWFQGERDAVLGESAVNAYEKNFENLTYRFRQLFGKDVPIIIAEIREGVSSNAALRAVVNTALNNVAAGDPKIGVVPTANLSWVSANNVHLNTSGYQALAPIWAAEAISLQSAAKTVLQYDSVSNGESTSTLSVLNFFTASDLVTNEDAVISIGGNTIDFGQHGSQDFTVSFGSGTDKFFQFGGDSETLSGSLADAVGDDGEWIGGNFTAVEDQTIDSFSFELYVNSSNSSSWSARDVGLFLRIGDSGEFTQFDADYNGITGDNGMVVFEDSFLVEAGEELQWRLAFTNRTNVSALPATRSTRVGTIRLNASAVPEAEILLGDCNLDGVVNFLDISPFIGLLSGSDYLAQADTNEDGVVDFLDISSFISLLSS